MSPSTFSADTRGCAFPPAKHSSTPSSQLPSPERLGRASSHRRPGKNQALYTQGLHLRLGPSPGRSSPPGCTSLLRGTPHCSSPHSPGRKAWATPARICASVGTCANASVPHTRVCAPLHRADQPRPSSRMVGRVGEAGACRELGKANTHPPTAWGPGQCCPEDLPGALRESQKVRDDFPRKPVTRTSAPAERPLRQGRNCSGYKK